MFEFSCAFSFVYIFKISYISYDTGTGEPDETYEFVYDTVWKDKLLEITVTYDGQSYPLPVASYDAIGNPTLLFDASLIWTGRELTSLNDIAYTYDANGLRTSKTLANGKKTEYYYSGSSLVFEHRDLTYNGQPDGMSLFYTYDDAGRLSNIRYIIDSIGYEHNYYPVCNSRGDVESIYDYHGTLMAKYTYDAWGDAVSIKDAQGHEIYDPMHIGKLNPFRYRGYYYDDETGLYYHSFLKKGGFHVSLTSISIIIDDSTPLVHIHRELHKDDRINKLGEILKEKIPLDFMYEFCDLVRDTGMRGKFSVVPMPGCLGDIVQGLRGFDQAQVELWLETARTRLAPAFDFCPEILTHGKAVDLTTGAILSENEEQWSFKQNRSTLAPYIAHALDLLRHKGIIATGVTSPWFFGIKVENDYAAAISDAFFSVLGKKDCWYFLHIKNDASDVHPIVSFSEGDRRVVSIPATTGDAFGDSLGSTRTDDEWINHMADYYLTFDGSSGVILDALARGSQPVILTHWQSLFSNGRHTGLMALRVLAERINKYLSDRVIWTNFTDLMNQALYGV